MSQIYFTSDLHFCHNRGFIYEPRGFNNIEEMNNTIVENWNNIVTNEDKVFILGDLILNDNEKGLKLLNKLNGHKFVILGNHDTPTRAKLYDGPTTVLGFADRIDYNEYHFYISHYPTLTSNLDGGRSLKQRILNLFGHTHSKEKFYQDNPTMYNVALDAHNNIPVSIDQIIEDIKAKRDECEKLL